VVEEIKRHKDKVLAYMAKELEKYGDDRMDVAEMEKLADIVKDMAEAEKACWEAEYYRSVSEAMESSGYTPDMMGYQGQVGRGGRMGYNPNRDSMGRYARRGYDHNPIQAVRDAMGGASPEERERMKRELRQIVGA
jgi:hypothetical protein